MRSQALVEYILLLAFISLSVVSVIKIVGEFSKLTFRKYTRDLGIEIPGERKVDELKRAYLKQKLKLIEMREKIKSYKFR